MSLLPNRRRRTLETQNKTPKIRELANKHGKSTNAIAKELGMSPDTVRAILRENSEDGTKSARANIQVRLPAIAQMVTSEILLRKDVDNGMKILEKAGVFPESQQAPREFNDNRLQIAIQQLLPEKPQKDATATTQAQLSIPAEVISA